MGDGILAQMSEDLKTEFPDMKGFSVRNLEGMRQWYRFWATDAAIALQLVAQIPWGHNLTIVAKIKNTDEAMFYVQKTIGVSEYMIAQQLPEEFRSSLPSIEAIEAELGEL
jgi:predicted nuclease of restriction endonuclease-like (RecB) superfamily